MTTSPLAAQLLRQGGALGFLAQLGKFLHRIVEDTDQQVAAQPRRLSLGGSPRWGRRQRRQLTQSCNWLGKPSYRAGSAVTAVAESRAGKRARSLCGLWTVGRS